MMLSVMYTLSPRVFSRLLGFNDVPTLKIQSMTSLVMFSVMYTLK